VSEFSRALAGIERRAPGLQLAMVLGIDGIPVEKRARGDGAQLETLAAEFTTLLRSSVSAGPDTGLGELTELSVVTGNLIAVLVGITPEYFLFGAFGDETEVGRARYALRVAALSLRLEFD
jgi:predicted regulator of Ras-like GTPase activity (Roadblock/LC7/MglB family)